MTERNSNMPQTESGIWWWLGVIGVFFLRPAPERHPIAD